MALTLAFPVYFISSVLYAMAPVFFLLLRWTTVFPALSDSPDTLVAAGLDMTQKESLDGTEKEEIERLRSV